MHDDGHVKRHDGQTLMQVTLPVPDLLAHKYRQITDDGVRTALPCVARLKAVPRFIISDWMTALASERMMQKTERVNALIAQGRDSWPDAFFIVLARAFGTGVNSDAFERLARSIPYNILLKHIANPLQIQALLLGHAGFLTEENPRTDDLRYGRMRAEFVHLCNMYRTMPLPVSVWKFGGVRPQAMPPVRVATLAALIAARPNLFSEIREATKLEHLAELLSVPKPTRNEPADAPKTADAPEAANATQTEERPFAMGQSTIHSLIINAVVPMLIAYGKWTSDESLVQRAFSFLEALPAEKNRYVGFCSNSGLTARNAFDSQALLQLYRNYCEPHHCLHCRVGHWLMKH
jgi:hypothetical protein